MPPRTRLGIKLLKDLTFIDVQKYLNKSYDELSVDFDQSQTSEVHTVCTSPSEISFHDPTEAHSPSKLRSEKLWTLH